MGGELLPALRFSVECFCTKTFQRTEERTRKKTGQVFRNYLFGSPMETSYGLLLANCFSGRPKSETLGEQIEYSPTGDGDYLPLRLSFSAGFSCKARFICKQEEKHLN